MAVTTPVTVNGMYLGGMNQSQADLIMQIRANKEIPNLKNMLFNFPYELCMEAIDSCRSVRDVVIKKGLDFNDYIAPLRDYQTVGTAFMYMSPRSIIADGCGLGKTAEVAALINYLKAKGEMTRFLIAVENSAIGQTQAELIKFTGLNVIALPSEATKIKRIINNIDMNKVDGIVIKHTTLRSDPFYKWLALNLNEDGTFKLFNTFFLDESSVIKNDKTKLYNYTKNICLRIPRVHFMNATAFETNIMDVYYQIDMMNPLALPKKWRIQKEYCTYTRTKYWTKENGQAKLNFRHEQSGYKNQEKFKESLKLIYFGRCKADIGMNTPSVYKVYEIEPSTEMLQAIEGGHRYSEVLNCPSLIEDINIPMDRKHVPKLDRLCELMQNEFSSDRVMIYCFHLEAQAAIKRELEALGRKPIILNGSISDTDERYRIQQEFNEGKYDVIITNIKKSLNLYGGDVCIFYSMETNPSKAFQIASRIDRNVDDKSKTFVMLLYKGTDEYRFFTTTVKQRAKDARDLTIDAKTTVDFFFESMIEDELIEFNNKS